MEWKGKKLETQGQVVDAIFEIQSKEEGWDFLKRYSRETQLISKCWLRLAVNQNRNFPHCFELTLEGSKSVYE